MTHEEAMALVAKHGSVSKAAKVAGMARTTLRRLLGNATNKAAKKAATKEVAGRSLSDFRNTYDKDTIIPGKIRAALKDLGESWEYESEFIKRSGVSCANLSAYRDEFADRIISIKQDNKRVWAGTVRFAKQLRDMV